MRHAFQMNPLSTLDKKKSTDYRLLRSALQRGDEVFHYTVTTLTASSTNILATGHWLTLTPDRQHVQTSDAATISLLDMHSVHMRQDPPFDMGYITATYMLDRVAEKIPVFNPPSVVRSLTEKILPLHFPDWTPACCISADPAAIQSFANAQQHLVLKPLYAFGGQDVFVIHMPDSNLLPIVDLLLKRYNAPLIAQAYIPEVTEGDKRIVVIDGQVIGAFLRVPQTGNHRANLAAGGSLQPISLSSTQQYRAQVVADYLKMQGVLLAGLDMIGDWLTEINITSPMGFAQLATLYGMEPEDTYWQAVTRQCAAR